MSIKKVRESNLELLRIISMMLVLLVHYLPLRALTTLDVLSNNPLKAFFNLEMHSIAIVCVHCFILISGFFGIRQRTQSFLSFLFQLLFWAVAGYVIAKSIDSYFMLSQSYNVTNLLGWYKGRWFVSAYLTLYVLSPLINSFIEKSSEDELLKFILAFYAFSTIYGYCFGSKEFATGLSAISLVGLYLIGAWLRKSNNKIVQWDKRYDLLSFVLCTLVLTFGSAFLLKVGITKSIYGYLNPIVIIESMFLFQFFRKLNIGRVKWINWLAASAFSVFLSHCHPFLGGYCNRLWSYLNNYGGIIYVVISMGTIFLLSVLIDKIRMLIWNALCNIVLWLSKKLTPPHSLKYPRFLK